MLPAGSLQAGVNCGGLWLAGGVWHARGGLKFASDALQLFDEHAAAAEHRPRGGRGQALCHVRS
jgi:hypothetical protein